MPLYVTEPGLRRLQEKEADLRTKVRESGSEVGEAAGLNCDWHDNAGFDEARRTLELSSRQLQEIRTTIAHAVVLTINEQAQSVRIGNTVNVTVIGDDDEEEKVFTIGAYGETNAKVGLIAYDSPMAAALIGHNEGDILENVHLGNRSADIVINRISPPSAKYYALSEDFYGENS